MSGMHAPWKEFRQGIGELVGIRAGLALTDDRIDRHLGLNVEDPMPVGLERVSASQYKGALFSALLECGSRWCDLGPHPRVMAWQQLSMDTDLYIAAHDLIHQQVHEQGVGLDYKIHDGCGLVAQDEEFAEHIRGPAVVGKLDMFVLNSRLDDLDMYRAEGQAFEAGGEALVRAARLLVAALRSDQHIDPWLRSKTAHATSIADLSDLFTRSDCPSNSSEFFDQRFIDFLVANVEELPFIHWRQFERLVAEYLHRQGYYCQLGPGSNDDGVDIRVWPSEAQSGGPPLLIVQCKRQRDKVEKVVVKALWADMQAENAVRGMVATTRALSPGAKDTILGRGYAIDSADQEAVAHWLEVMRTPGEGPSLI
ncbi:hypothetical protein FHT44_006204 [Mycolicibacterium sp. BK634]|uniref:restriction endonuclease n=1 Tax=Mycolicibacterium sp. BK634 TaxID=2587099 RepID=UPI001610767D|nr:restriction endonuclease [Mycolicibacterium sp. BK634]MBB3753682.1 hypothetical protein [Mycolicibacterium sp. BK634]